MKFLNVYSGCKRIRERGLWDGNYMIISSWYREFSNGVENSHPAITFFQILLNDWRRPTLWSTRIVQDWVFKTYKFFTEKE